MKVGDSLYWVPNRGHGTPEMVKVTKVGRKWVTLDNLHRIDIDTLRADGGQYTSPGSCYPDEASYKQIVELDAAWSRFQRMASSTYARPQGVTLSQIENAASSLFGRSAKETGDRP